MATKALELGETGEFQLMPQVQVEGQWQRAPQARQAKRWRARARVKKWNGETVTLDAYRSTKRGATEALEAKVADVLRTGDSALTGATKLSELAETYKKQLDRNDARLSANTIRQYKRSLDRVILGDDSSIKGLTIAQVGNVPRVKAFLQATADAHGAGVGKTTRTVLAAMLDLTLEAGVLDVNPVRGMRPVRTQRPVDDRRDHSRSLTDKEAGAIMAHADALATAEDLDPRTLRKRETVADLLAFLSGTGARLGEALTLKWEHVYLEQGWIALHGTKTAGSRRRLDLPQWLVERLRARRGRLAGHYATAERYAKHTDDKSRAEVVEELRRFATAAGSEGYVFSSPAKLDPTALWDSSNCNRAVREVLDAVEGVAWATPHSFRRTVATKLHEQGAPLVRIADQLGHSSPMMTVQRYLGRDFDGDKSDLAKML